MGISLYSTRLILNALGSTDFGIFSLTASVISLLSFLNAAMATSTQRFLSFYQGKESLDMQKQVFKSSMIIHLFLAIILVLILLSAGIFLFNGVLNIPVDRLDAARYLYYCMCGSLFISIISVPFTATLVAHENMTWIAIILIKETLARLAIAIFISYIDSSRLETYGILTVASGAINFIMHANYCFRKYDECTMQGMFQFSKKITKELLAFVGWNLLGSLCNVARNQGIPVMLNIFLGTIVNASYGVAAQISGQMSLISSNMLKAINPQIMKAEGAGERQKMLDLAMAGSKFGFLVLAAFAIPCIYEMQALLNFWLGNPPEYSVIFCQLILSSILINQLTIGLPSAIQSTGKIKIFQIFISLATLSYLPLAYVFLKLKLPPYFVLVLAITTELLIGLIRVAFLKKVTGLHFTYFIRKVLIKQAIPVMLSVVLCYVLVSTVDFSFRFILTIPLITLFFLASVYMFSLQPSERNSLNQVLKKMLSKVQRRKFVTQD